MISRPRALSELILGAVIWGFSFICAKWSLDGVGPMWALTLRFLIAIALVAPWWMRKWDLHHARLSRSAGIALGITLLLQLAGLRYTTVAKCCFITVLYVVWVPFAEAFAFRKRPPLSHFIWVLVALAGTVLMTGFEVSDWNRGDVLTLICSFTSTFHIIAIEKAQTKIQSGWQFNIYQSLWVGVVCLIVALAFEPFPALPLAPLALGGMTFNAIFVTLIAFWIQIRAQSVLSSSSVSLLFLLEGPLAALFGYWVFRETLTPVQILGGLMILGAAGGTIQSQLRYNS